MDSSKAFSSLTLDGLISLNVDLLSIPAADTKGSGWASKLTSKDTSLTASPHSASTDSLSQMQIDNEIVRDILEGLSDDSSDLPDTERPGIVLHCETTSSKYSKPNMLHATADCSGCFTDCTDQFLTVTGLNDFRMCSIISLAKFATPEELQQHAYMLDVLASSRNSDSGAFDELRETKWIAELDNTYLNMNYEIHVTLAAESAEASSHHLNVELVEIYCSSRSSFVGTLTRLHSTNFLGNLRILVVDDSGLVLKIVSRLIRAEGHIVDCKNDGVEALEALKNTEYDAVIMDIHMSEMSGLEASYEFRNHESLMHQYRGKAQGSKLKIIAMSSDSSESLKPEVMRAGFDGFISKPLTVRAFRDLKLKPTALR